MNILFRVDSSSKIGLGHVMRCLVLAEQYKEDSVVFATQDLKGNANREIIDKGYRLITLNDGSVDELIQRINELNIDMVVFDHYGINSDFEKAIKNTSGVKILSFDDIYEKHYCDILLNHNIYADAGKYKGLVPDFCEIRCGEKYTLVRDEFKKIEIKKNLSNKGKLVVFVCLGGADANNISLPVLEILSDFDDIIVNLATTSSNNNIDQLLDFSKQYKNINICINCNVAELICNSDFSIITPSVIVHEVMTVKLPFIAIMTADNQAMMYQYLCENHYPAFKHDELNELRMEIKKNMSKDEIIVRNEYGFFEIKNKPSKKELQEYYANKYYQEGQGSYELSYDKAEIEYLLNKIEQKHVVTKTISNVEKGSLLDVGSGEGFTLSHFDNLGWDCVGLDFSSAGVKGKNPEQARLLIQGDIFENLEEIIKGDKKFDLIFLDNVLEHVLKPFELLVNLNKVINDGGILVVDVPNDFSLFQKYLAGNNYIDRDFWICPPDHLSYFNKDGLINLAKDTGWKINKVISDYPIELDLLSLNSNYVNNPSVGKASHRKRVEFENFIHSVSVEKTNQFYESLIDLGLGRNIIGFFSKV